MFYNQNLVQYHTNLNQHYINQHYINQYYVNKNYVNKNYVNKNYVNQNYVNQDYVNQNYVNQDYVNQDYVNEYNKILEFLKENIINNRLDRFEFDKNSYILKLKNLLNKKKLKTNKMYIKYLLDILDNKYVFIDKINFVKLVNKCKILNN